MIAIINSPLVLTLSAITFGVVVSSSVVGRDKLTNNKVLEVLQYAQMDGENRLSAERMEDILEFLRSDDPAIRQTRIVDTTDFSVRDSERGKVISTDSFGPPRQLYVVRRTQEYPRSTNIPFSVDLDLGAPDRFMRDTRDFTK